ncbi:MAG TPA: histidine kinase [Acidimicrobiales bacterium]|nr:histidine kinase [Acidimicrobiales bacterium]
MPPSLACADLHDSTASLAGEHVWVRFAPWWHFAFVVTVLGTGALSGFELQGSWRLWASLGLYGALCVLYIATPGKFSRQPARLPYMAGAAAIFSAACFVYPGAGFLLFILVPHFFMLANGIRPAMVAVLGMISVNAASSLDYGGVSQSTVVSVAVFGVFSLFLAGLLGGYITRIVEQSAQRAELIKELERTRAELAEMSRQSGALAERERLAREIHDALAQGFTSLIMLLQAAQASLERGDLGTAEHHLALAEPAAREGLAEARSLIAALSPVPLQDASLVAAVERVCQDAGSRFGFDASLKVTGSPGAISHNAEIVLLRAAQEALANVGRHARACSVAVVLSFDALAAVLEVRDDGTGFSSSRPAGFGLTQLRARASELGGEVDVLSAPGEGTVVTVRLPLGPVAPSPVAPGPPRPSLVAPGPPRPSPAAALGPAPELPSDLSSLRGDVVERA